MKKILLFVFIFTLVSGAFAQPYKGTPWTGTAWTFGTDNAVNFMVGTAYPWKNGTYNGIPHYLYDIGEVDTTKLAGEDLAGNFVAGAGGDEWAGTSDNYREAQATTDSKTLSASDIATQASDHYGGAFTTHNNRAVIKRSGGWYRYLCNFADGNYRLSVRMWGNNNSSNAFWFRAYDKATMNPLCPWTRYHPGITDPKDSTLVEGFTYLDVTQLPYSGYPVVPIKKTEWYSSVDEYTLSGDVVIEISDPGPTKEYDVNVAVGGCLGEIAFEYMGTSADKFAPVAEVWKEQYDEGDEITLKLSEPGTLWLVPNGTAEADLDAANIDKKEMTTDTYTKDAGELLGDTIQLVTRDAAGNIRFTSAITVRNMLIADTTQGVNGDSIWLNVTRDGVAALLPPGVNPDFGSVMVAVAAGDADTANVDAGGGNALVIKNLSGDQNCNLYMFDISGDVIVVSDPVPFQLGAGGGSIGIHQNIAEVNVYLSGNQIILRHNGEFEDLYIYDLLGKQQMHRNVTSTSMEFDASDLLEGVYIMKLYGHKEGMVSRKFIIGSR